MRYVMGMFSRDKLFELAPLMSQSSKVLQNIIRFIIRKLLQQCKLHQGVWISAFGCQNGGGCNCRAD